MKYALFGGIPWKKPATAFVVEVNLFTQEMLLIGKSVSTLISVIPPQIFMDELTNIDIWWY